METRPNGYKRAVQFRIVLLLIAFLTGATGLRAQDAPGFDDVNRAFAGRGGPLLANVGNPISGWMDDLRQKVATADRVGTPAIASAAAVLGAFAVRAIFTSAYPGAGAVGTLAALALGGAGASAAAQLVTTGKVDLSHTVVDGVIPGAMGGGSLGSNSGWAKALAPIASIVGGTVIKHKLPELKRHLPRFPR
jgi:hypothetical protein